MKKALPVTIVFTVLALALTSFGQSHPQSHHAKITASKAGSIALAKYPGKVVGKIELENEEGIWQYSVMVKSGKKLREVMVNAKTGKIEDVEVTTAAKEAKEKAEEAKAKAKKHKGKTGH